MEEKPFITNSDEALNMLDDIFEAFPSSLRKRVFVSQLLVNNFERAPALDPRRYGGLQVDRHYHGPNHLLRIWKHFKELKLSGEGIAGFVAQFTIFHDVVYCIGKKNLAEELSVEAMQMALADPNLDVTREILATIDHTLYRPWLSDPIKLCLDLDLVDMGTNEYWINGAKLNAEAESAGIVVNSLDFKQRRRDFLRAMLKREKIFYTPMFASLESAARTNLEDDLFRIDQHLSNLEVRHEVRR